MLLNCIPWTFLLVFREMSSTGFEKLGEEVSLRMVFSSFLWEMLHSAQMVSLEKEFNCLVFVFEPSASRSFVEKTWSNVYLSAHSRDVCTAWKLKSSFSFASLSIISIIAKVAWSSGWDVKPAQETALVLCQLAHSEHYGAVATFLLVTQLAGLKLNYVYTEPQSELYSLKNMIPMPTRMHAPMYSVLLPLPDTTIFFLYFFWQKSTCNFVFFFSCFQKCWYMEGISWTSQVLVSL